MKNYKKLMLCLILLMTGGCTKDMNKDKPTREEVKQEMLDYVNDKYGMEFECESIRYADWYNPGAEFMYVYPKGKTAGKPEDTFLVKRFEYKGGYKFTDGYVGYLKFPKYQEMSERIIKKHFPEAIGEMPKFFNELYPGHLTPNSTFDQFKKYTDSVLQIPHTIYIGYEGSIENLKEEIKGLEQELSETYASGDLVVFCYEMKYFKEEILSGNIDLDETDPDINTILIERNLDWGEILQFNPESYYMIEEQE